MGREDRYGYRAVNTKGNGETISLMVLESVWSRMATNIKGLFRKEASWEVVDSLDPTIYSRRKIVYHSCCRKTAFGIDQTKIISIRTQKLIEYL